MFLENLSDGNFLQLYYSLSWEKWGNEERINFIQQAEKYGGKWIVLVAVQSDSWETGLPRDYFSGLSYCTALYVYVYTCATEHVWSLEN